MAWLVTKYVCGEPAAGEARPPCLVHLWYVIPTLPRFLAFPPLLARLGFWPALLACVVITAVCFALFAFLLRRFGIELL